MNGGAGYVVSRQVVKKLSSAVQQGGPCSEDGGMAITTAEDLNMARCFKAIDRFCHLVILYMNSFYSIKVTLFSSTCFYALNIFLLDYFFLVTLQTRKLLLYILTTIVVTFLFSNFI